MKTLIHNLVFLAGSGLAAYGMWLMYPPAAYMAGGIYVIALAVLAAPSKAK